jgi:hypothetical protein
MQSVTHPGIRNAPTICCCHELLCFLRELKLINSYGTICIYSAQHALRVDSW